jgi:hypothetical protein
MAFFLHVFSAVYHGSIYICICIFVFVIVYALCGSFLCGLLKLKVSFQEFVKLGCKLIEWILLELSAYIILIAFRRSASCRFVFVA